jgi:hypothetical protein
MQGSSRPWWEQIWGSFADDPGFLEAMQYGREYRRAQRDRQARISSGKGRGKKLVFQEMTSAQVRRSSGMNAISLEERVAKLENEVAKLKAQRDVKATGDPWLDIVWGAFADNPAALKEAARIGREWRESFRPKPRKTQKK